jgi:hypothetical protein
MAHRKTSKRSKARTMLRLADLEQSNGQATQDEAQKDWHVQPVAAPDQQVVPANYQHAGFRLQRAGRDLFLIELRGMWHKYSPR